MKHPEACRCGKCTSSQPTRARIYASDQELELIHSGRRKQFWLAVKRGPSGARLPCLIEPWSAIRLWPDAGSGVKKATVTVSTVRRVVLSRMTERDVRPLGMAGGLRSAVNAWQAEHPGAEEVWVVAFTLSDMTEELEPHREQYLKAKGVGLTDDPRRAVRGEPAVTSEQELKLAREARDRRQLEDEQQATVAKQGIEAHLVELRRRADDEEIGDLKFIERRLAKIARRRQERAA